MSNRAAVLVRREEIAVSLIQGRELWLTGTFRYATTYPTAIVLLGAGRVDPGALITGHFGLDETERALRAGHEAPASVKAMLHP